MFDVFDLSEGENIFIQEIFIFFILKFIKILLLCLKFYDIFDVKLFKRILIYVLYIDYFYNKLQNYFVFLKKWICF